MTSTGPRWWVWLSGLSLRRLSIAVVTVAVLLSGVFGGLRRAPEPTPAALEVGRAATVGPFELTIDRVRWVDDLGEGAPTPSGRFVAVVATVRNTTDRSVTVGTLRDVVQPQSVNGLYAAVGGTETADDPAAAKEEVLVLADGSRLTTVVPHLTYEVVILWDQSTAVPPPSELGLQLSSLTYRQSSVDDQMLWTDPVPADVGSFDVREGS